MNWATVYNHNKSKGMDQNDAAYRADMWEAKQRRKPCGKSTIRLRNVGDRMIVELNGKPVINEYCPTEEIAIDVIQSVNFAETTKKTEPNYCENCAMDLSTCDCVNQRPATATK